MSRDYMSGAQWVEKYNSTHWDLNALLQTTIFAATRMLDFLDPSDPWSPEKEKNRVPMEKAVNALRRVNIKNINDLRTVLGRIHKESFATVTHCIRQFGDESMQTWIPTFQEYQAIISSAIRYVDHLAEQTRKRLIEEQMRNHRIKQQVH